MCVCGGGGRNAKYIESYSDYSPCILQFQISSNSVQLEVKNATRALILFPEHAAT